MKKYKKKAPDVAIITGNPNDQIVIGPEDKPRKIQTESAKLAVKQLKTKLTAPDLQYIAPTERVDVDNQNVDKQVKHVRKIVTKISTQPVTEEELNIIFDAVSEASESDYPRNKRPSKLASIAASPVRAAGKLAQLGVLGAGAALVLPNPTGAAATAGAAAHYLANKMANFKKMPSKDELELQKYRDEVMKSRQQRPSQQKNQPSKQQVNQQQSQVPPPPPLRPVPSQRTQTSRTPIHSPRSGPRSYTTGAGNLPSLNTALTVPPPGANLAFTPPTPPARQTTAQQAPAQQQPATRTGRPQGGGKISGQLSQTPSAVRRRNQRAATRNARVIVSHWDHEGYLSNKLEESLWKKAAKAEVEYTTVLEVFARGVECWDPDSNLTADQFAMQRVNSYLAQGKNFHNEDSDLQEANTVLIGHRRYRKPGSMPKTTVFKKTLSKLSRFKTPYKKGNSASKRLSSKLKRIKRQILRGPQIQESEGLWANIHAKRERIKAGSGEKMRKPGSKGAPTKQNFIDASESVNESFVVDRAAGYSGLYTAADLGIKIQGGFALHPSVVEEGGAINDNESKFHVTYDYYGSNREKPLYTKTIPVRAKSKEEAIHTVRKLVGGRNHRIETEGK